MPLFYLFVCVFNHIKTLNISDLQNDTKNRVVKFVDLNLQHYICAINFHNLKITTMKQKKILTAICSFLLLGCISINASSSTSPDTNSDGNKGILKERNDDPNRRRSPSRTYLEYEYTGTGIFIYAPDYISEIDIKVIGNDNGAFFASHLSQTDGLYLETGPLSGSFTIICTTDSGSVYTGIAKL